MSKIYDIREAIKASVAEANLGLAADDIVIERQADIITKVNKAVAKRDGNGVALTIEPAEGRNADEQAEELDLEVTLKVKLWVVPVYDTETKAEEDIFEPLMQHLHHLRVDASHAYMELRVAGFRDVPDPEFLVREINLKQRVIF